MFALLLKSQKVDLSCADPLHAEVAVFSSCDERLPMIRYLLSLGVDPNQKCHDKQCQRDTFPLNYAARCGLTNVVKCLLDAGADLFLETQSAGSAYGRAKKQGFSDLVAEYKRYGAPYPKEELPIEYPAEYHRIRRHDKFLEELRLL